MEIVRTYFADLNAALGGAWNRFWFIPRRASTLGVLRAIVGLMAFYTIATYGADLDRWFGPGGMMPSSLVQGLYESPNGNYWSILDFLPPDMLWPVYWASLAAIGLFTLGIGGRVTAIAATLATLSFFSRAPLVTGEFEPVLAFLMVYLCVGRASDEFSLPALLRARSSASATPGSSLLPPVSATNTIAQRLLQIHVAIVHLMMGLAMLAAPESAWWNGEGIWLAATRPGMALVDFSFLTDHPRIVAAWSHAITLYLLAFPVLVWNRYARPLMLAVGILIWVSLALASGWLMFCLAMLAGLIAFSNVDRIKSA